MLLAVRVEPTGQAGGSEFPGDWRRASGALPGCRRFRRIGSRLRIVGLFTSLWFAPIDATVIVPTARAHPDLVKIGAHGAQNSSTTAAASARARGRPRWRGAARGKWIGGLGRY
jgi:hypothetical protein